jgi:hypothetical protein
MSINAFDPISACGKRAATAIKFLANVRSVPGILHRIKPKGAFRRTYSVHENIASKALRFVVLRFIC